MARRALDALVAPCIRRPWATILVAMLLAAAGLYVCITRFAINTDTARLISPQVAWRQNEAAMDAAFPQRSDLIVAVLDADSPERAEAAAATLAAALGERNDLVRHVSRPGAGPFFSHNGLLFLSRDEVDDTLNDLAGQVSFLKPVAADPSLRGLMKALSVGLQAVRGGEATLAEVAVPLTRLAETFERVLAGIPAKLSWRQMLSDKAPDPRQSRRLVLVKPVLNFGALEPASAAIGLVRATAASLGLTPDKGVRLRLTGPAPLADEEFATVAENALLNGLGTVAVIAALLFLALRSWRVIGAVLATIFVGLVVTAAIGLLTVGEFNLISVAFMALFVGLGIDFGIQYAVRYRAERYERGGLRQSLLGAARSVGWSLTLAAVSLVAGFFSFLPTEYRGVSELGLIAGMGMIIAYLLSLTLLPALIVVLRPPGEPEAVGTAALAPVDRWIARHRRLVLVATAVVVLGGAPALLRLDFDSNPMNLRSSRVESVATFLDLAHDPETSPNGIEVLAPSLADARALAFRLSALPEVARAVTLASFVPDEQDAKLAAIRDAAAVLLPSLSPASVAPPPSDAETVTALRATAAELREAAAREPRAGAAATRLADAVAALAEAAPERRRAAEEAALANFEPLLQQLRLLLTPEPVTLNSLPRDLAADWVAADGRARIEVLPKGEVTDNADLARFAKAVRAVAPNATGAPVTIVESGRTVVRAFVEAGLFALAAIFAILAVALRRPLDVALTLGPLVLAAVMTLETMALVGMKLNFANIIALPLMLAVGVAFHIYYVVAWRAGETEMLASSLTRAIFFSALTTGVAFGSLCLSSHPGTASMGALLALSLFFTLLAAFVIVPAFLGPPRHGPGSGQASPDPQQPEATRATAPAA